MKIISIKRQRVERGADMVKNDKQRSPESAAISTLLGKDTAIEGSLTFHETIRVDGRIKGKIESGAGTIIIGENADIEADITVATAVIRGKVTGRIEAGQRIEIYPPARLSGDISAPSINIENGVVFNGNCRMPGQAPDSTKKLPK
jgi:cytoskeletal protein CcmA (bactofilin family)